MIKIANKITVIMLLCIFLTACKEETDVSLSDDTSVSSLEQIKDTQQQSQEVQEIVVYVNGAVKNPGVYTLKQGSRIYQAVAMAGGMTDKAKKDSINLAETAADAQNIHIMTKKEYQKYYDRNEDISADDQENYGGTMKTGQKNEDNISLININTDNQEQLMTLPGIGESKATAIITYREENGRFSSKEDIKNVSGIGEATYANLKDLITVG